MLSHTLPKQGRDVHVKGISTCNKPLCNSLFVFIVCDYIKKLIHERHFEIRKSISKKRGVFHLASYVSQSQYFACYLTVTLW